MPSVLAVALSLVACYLSTYVYNFIRSYVDACRSNMPYFILPFDQNSFLWMVVSVPLEPWLKRNMPKWIFDRLSLTIYGFEFHEGHRPFTQYVSPASPTAQDGQSYVMVGFGMYEVSTKDPALAMEILRRPADFQQHQLTELVLGKFGRHVLSSDGEIWARQRRIIAKCINERISKTVFEEGVKHTKGLTYEILNPQIEQGPTTGTTLRLFDMMKKITINVLSGAGMGASVEWDDSTGDQPPQGFRTSYMQAVQAVVAALEGPIILPMWLLRRYPRFLPGHEMLRKLGTAIEEFPKHTQVLLHQERERIHSAGGGTRNNIMSQLLQVSKATDGVNHETLTEEEMTANLFIFTAAGFDTTANTLSYALVLLCRHPQWQDWIIEEVDRITSTTDSQSDYQALFPKAIRVLALMHETLRLFPPLIHIMKQTKTPQTLTVAPTESSTSQTIHIPAKATVYINVVALHTEPRVWQNLHLHDDEQPSPTDELRFRPTRWLDPSIAPTALYQPPRGSYLPWSAGPRVCPGQKMAQVEFVAIFLTLFRRYRIEAVRVRKDETRQEMDERLEGRLRDSVPKLTLQMRDVYDVDGEDEAKGSGKGLMVRLVKR